VPICRAAFHSRGRDWCPGWPNPPGFAIPGSPPLQLAVGEDADLAARAGDAQEPGLATGGAGAAGRERPGSPARRPVLISTARPLASRQLARDRPVTGRLTATGEQSGGDARGAGTDAMPGSPLSAAMAGAPGFIWGKAGAGKDAGGPGPSRSSGSDAVASGRSGPGQLQSRAGAREQGQDVADGGFLAGGFGQREVRLDLVAVAAAVFLLRRVAGSVGLVTMPQALRSVLPGPAASRGAARPGRGRCTAATGRGWSGHSSSSPRRMVTISRNLLLVSNCECKLRADTRDQPPTAAKVPRGHRREPPMVLIGPVVIVAALMVIAVPRIIRRQV
jgi:hypothetical protein